MKDFRDFCTFSSRQHGQRATPKRGHVIIDDGDGHEYQYRIYAFERRAFKDWARITFTNFGEYRLTGRWPNYQVERRSH